KKITDYIPIYEMKTMLPDKTTHLRCPDVELKNIDSYRQEKEVFKAELNDKSFNKVSEFCLLRLLKVPPTMQADANDARDMYGPLVEQEVSFLKKIQSDPDLQSVCAHVHKITELSAGDTTWVVMELGVTLDVYLQNQDLSFPEKKTMAIEIINAAQTLYSKGYLHRDLKISNFIMAEGRVKLIDFGDCGVLKGVFKTSIKERDFAPRGTLSNLAPELISTPVNQGKGTFVYDEKTEIFSLGVVLYNLFVNPLMHPIDLSMKNGNFTNQSKLKKIYHNYLEKSGKWSVLNNSRIPNRQLFDLLQKMLAIDPSKRPGFSEVISTLKKMD
ncbi:MAG: protein kinase, partial [Chlamydiia bacterium]|nr:protein kinase [Chlamydiia bacterium]